MLTFDILMCSGNLDLEHIDPDQRLRQYYVAYYNVGDNHAQHEVQTEC